MKSNQMSIKTQAKLLHTRKILHQIKDTSFNYAKLNKRYPNLDNLTEEEATELTEVFEKMAIDLQEFLNKELGHEN